MSTVSEGKRMTKRKPPLQAIRATCLDCCCGSVKYVRFCPCDGQHGSECPLWLYRFGMRPATAARKCGERFLDPAQMPDADVPLEECGRTERDKPPASPPAKKVPPVGHTFAQAAGNRAIGRAARQVR